MESRRYSGVRVGRAAASAQQCRCVLPLLGLLLVCLGLPCLASAKNTEWQTYISDDFSGQSAFFTGQSGEALYSIDKGRYVIDGKHAVQDSLSALTDNLYYYYVEAQCKVLETSAGELAFSGLVFHYTKQLENSRAYYVFYIYGDGYYGAKRVVGDEVQIVIPLSRSAEIDPVGTNVLAVDAQGTRFDLYINGKYVNGFTDVRIDGGGFGFYVSKNTVGVFDNFKVKVEKRGGGNDGPGFPEATDSGDGGNGKYPKLSIPKDPNRPTYPWEIGVRKHGKGKHPDDAGADDGSSATGPANNGKTKPAKDAGSKDKGGKSGKDSSSAQGKAQPAEQERHHEPPPPDEPPAEPSPPPADPGHARSPDDVVPDPQLSGARHPAYEGPAGQRAPEDSFIPDRQLIAAAPPPTVYEEPVKAQPAPIEHLTAPKPPAVPQTTPTVKPSSGKAPASAKPAASSAKAPAKPAAKPAPKAPAKPAAKTPAKPVSKTPAKPAARSGKSASSPTKPAKTVAPPLKPAPAPAPLVPATPPSTDDSSVLLVPADTLRKPGTPAPAPETTAAAPDDTAPHPRLTASSGGVSLTDLGQAANAALVRTAPAEPSPLSAAARGTDAAWPTTAPAEPPQPELKPAAPVKAPKPAKAPKAAKPQPDPNAKPFVTAVREPKPKKEKPVKPAKQPKAVKPEPAPKAPDQPETAAKRPSLLDDRSANSAAAQSEHERLAQTMRSRSGEDTSASAVTTSSRKPARAKPAPAAEPAATTPTGEGVQLPQLDPAAPVTPEHAPAPEPDPAPSAAPPIVASKAAPHSDQAWQSASQASSSTGDPSSGENRAAPLPLELTEPAAPESSLPEAGLPASAAPLLLLQPEDSAPASAEPLSVQATPQPAVKDDPTAIPLPPQVLNPQLGALQPATHGPAGGPSADADPFTGKPGLVRLTDNFSTPRWPVQDNQGSVYRYVEGAYQIDNLKAQKMAISYQDEKLGEVRMDATCDYLEGSKYAGYGCAVRFSVGPDGQLSYYAMFVTNAGECVLLKVADGQENVLADWRAASGYQPGQPNALRLEAIDGQVRAYVNGVLALQAKDDSLGPGGYALLAGPGVKVRYTSLGLAGLHPSGN